MVINHNFKFNNFLSKFCESVLWIIEPDSGLGNHPNGTKNVYWSIIHNGENLKVTQLK